MPSARIQVPLLPLAVDVPELRQIHRINNARAILMFAIAASRLLVSVIQDIPGEDGVEKTVHLSYPGEVCRAPMDFSRG